METVQDSQKNLRWNEMNEPYNLISYEYERVKLKDLELTPSLYNGVKLNKLTMTGGEYVPITASAYKDLLKYIGVSSSTAKKMEGTKLLDTLIHTRLQDIIEESPDRELVFALAPWDDPSGYCIRGVSLKQPLADPKTVLNLWSKKVDSLVDSRVLYSVQDTRSIWMYKLRDSMCAKFLPDRFSLLLVLDYDDINCVLNERIALRYFEENYTEAVIEGSTETMVIPDHKEYTGSFWRKGIVPCVEYRNLNKIDVNTLSEKMDENKLLKYTDLESCFTPVIEAITTTKLFDFTDYPVLDMKAKKAMGKKAYEQSNLRSEVGGDYVRNNLPLHEWLIEVGDSMFDMETLKKSVKLRHFVGDVLTYVTEEYTS